MSEHFDVVIVGSGPAGLAAGVQAAKRGLSHLVLERGPLANTIDRYQKGKWVMSEPAKLALHEGLDMRFEAASREQVLARWTEDSQRAGMNLRQGPDFEVTHIEGEKGSFGLVLRDGQTLEAGRIVLAIGVRGNRRTFGVPGDDLPHIHYDLEDPDAHEGERIIVVGTGDAGIENAVALAERDNDVAIVNRGDEFPRAKARNRTMIEAAVKAGEITHYTNSRTVGFEPQAILLKTDQGELRVDADLVIGQLGALPPRRFLEEIGIHFTSDARDAVPPVNDELESNVPGIYLLGAVVGRPLIKACMNAGYEVIEHILGNRVIPADEPLLQELLGAIPGDVEQIVHRIRETIPIFGGLTPIQIREFLVESEVKSLSAGTRVFARNEASQSFYSILEGSVRVDIPTPGEDTPSLSASLARGEFFGETSLVSGRRRSGDVTTTSDSILIETSRLAMTKLIKSSEEVSRVVDRIFIERQLENLAPEMSREERTELASSSVILRFEQGELLFSEGDAADGLHWIRRGSVAISRTRGGRESVVSYVQAGNILGEVALIRPDGARTATAKAMVQTETVLLPVEEIRTVLERNTGLRRGFEERAIEWAAANEGRAGSSRHSELVGWLSEVGIGEATDFLLIDESLCIRCDNCETACAATHGGISRLDREGGPRLGNIHLPTACQHCENPKCMTDCPPDAIHRHPDGEVYIEDSCIGCGNCATYCPYNVIQMTKLGDESRASRFLKIFSPSEPAEPAEGAHEVAVKCDLCRKLPAPRGTGTRSACVNACPTGAIVRVRETTGLVESLLRDGD